MKVFGENTISGKAYQTIIIMTISAGTADNTALDNLMQESLAMEFDRAGLRSLRIDEIPQLQSPSISRGAVLAAAAERGIGLAAFCSYTSDGTDIRFELSCIDPENPEFSAVSSKSGNIDLSLDTLFAEAVDEIILALKEKDPALVFAPLTAVDPGPVPPEPETAVQAEPALSSPEPQEPAPPDKFYVSLGSAPFIAVGKVNYYFSIGSITSLYADYLLKTSFGDFGFGLFTGIQVFRAKGFISDSVNFLIPVGADLHYGTPAEKDFSLFLHFTGGLAVFVFSPPDGNSLSKIVGYASGGAGGALRFKKVFGITLDVSYFIYFEQLYPIMGIAPSVYLTMRF